MGNRVPEISVGFALSACSHNHPPSLREYRDLIEKLEQVILLLFESTRFSILRLELCKFS